MKRLVGILLLVIGAGAFAAEDAPKEITKVVEVQGASKDKIYAATKTWIAESFRSAKAVIQLDDKDAGKIIGKIIIKYPCKGFLSCATKGDRMLNATLRVDIKDGKFRMGLSEVSWSAPGTSTSPGFSEVPLTPDALREDGAMALDSLADQLKTTIASEKTDQNW